MPKKIKKEKEQKLKSNKEKLIRVDNIHYIVILVVIILILICASVGVYVYKKDKYHAHSSVAISSFVYTEKVDEGYNIYQVSLDNNEVYVYFNTPETNIPKKWSNGKYLDFNEELYLSGIFDEKSEVGIENGGSNIEWSLEASLINGDTIYYSNNSVNKPDKTKFAQVINKYFGHEIIYK